jgi:hypothetical protein
MVMEAGRTWTLVATFGTAFGAAAAPALAAPQWNVGMTLGGVSEDATSSPIHEQLHLGARGDVLLLRSRGNDMAIGPYVDLATAAFREWDLGGGVGWLLPVRDDLPLVLSGGLFARNGEGYAWAPGLEGTLFWGSRSYNFHASYGMAAGVFLQTRYVPGSPGQTDLVIGLQMDGEMMLLPVLLIAQLLRPEAGS